MQIDVELNPFPHLTDVLSLKFGDRGLPGKAECRIAARTRRLNEFDLRLDSRLSVGDGVRGRAPDVLRPESEDHVGSFARLGTAPLRQAENGAVVSELHA